MTLDDRDAHHASDRASIESPGRHAGRRSPRRAGASIGWLIFAGVFLVYALVLPVAILAAGRGALALGLVPVVAAAWVTGMWGGAAAGVLVHFVNGFLVYAYARGDGILYVRDLPLLDWAIPVAAVTLLGIFVGYVHDLREALRRQNLALQHIAARDPLTASLNRRAFAEGMARILDRPGLHALLYIDLDGFKSVNDTYGHATGDRLLAIVAGRLRHAVRPNDLVGRIGGDEFALCIPDLADAEQAAAIAQRVRRSVHGTIHIHGHAVPLSGSAGIALAPRDGTTPEALLHVADQAMYRAKAHGSEAWRPPDAEGRDGPAPASSAWDRTHAATQARPERLRPAEPLGSEALGAPPDPVATASGTR